MKIYGGKMRTFSKTFELEDGYYFVVLLESVTGYVVQVRSTDNLRRYKTVLIESSFHKTLPEAKGYLVEVEDRLEDQEISYKLFSR